jgi:hypothetical protein
MTAGIAMTRRVHDRDIGGVRPFLFVTTFALFQKSRRKNK